jgi:hypothetical protein
MSQPSPIYRYATHSRACLDRARAQLARFDADDDVEALLNAALQLRYGIEARVWEYLEVALRQLGQDPGVVPDYVASKLLRRLAAADPHSGRASVLMMRDEQSGATSSLQYTPVPGALAALHGRLGELLHHRLFVANKHWYVRRALPFGGSQSLGNFRELLSEGIAGLEYATSGTLLANPKFTEMVSDVMQGPSGND